MSLVEQLTQPGKRGAIVRDAAVVLDAEVADKRGFSGVAVKGAFKVVHGLKPGFIPDTIDALLDDFVKQVEPFYDSWKAAPKGTLTQHFVANGPAVADSLLFITDERARKSPHKTLVKTYGKLRPMGKEHVTASMPRVGALIEKHTKDL